MTVAFETHNKTGLPYLEKGGLTLRVEYDDSPENPLENCDYDPSAFFYTCSSSEYGRNDHEYLDNSESIHFLFARIAAKNDGKDRFQAILEEIDVHYRDQLYEARQVYLKLKDFTFLWSSDRRMRGYAVLGVKTSNISKEAGYGCTPMEYLEGILEEYCQWASGNVFGYVIDTPDEKHIESCWGYFGGPEYCAEEGLHVLNSLLAPSTEAGKKVLSSLKVINFTDLSEAIQKFGHAEYAEYRLNDLPKVLVLAAKTVIDSTKECLDNLEGIATTGQKESLALLLSLIDITEEAKLINKAFRNAPMRVAELVLQLMAMGIDPTEENGGQA